MKNKIAIGCDPNALELKETLINHLESLGYEVADFGSDDPIYANTAREVAEVVVEGRCNRGILICGTGLGMSLAANKVKGAYAVTCSDPYSVERSIRSNNVNLLTLGSMVIGEELAKYLVTLWLSVHYESGGRSEPKIQRIYDIEKEYFKIS